MAGTTSPLGFPYPTGTDRVMDGDNAIQALAEAVDDYFVGATGVVTIDANMQNAGQGSAIVKRGGMATFFCEMSNKISWNPAWTMATIPVGFRPVRRALYVTAPSLTSNQAYLMEVRTDGGVYCFMPLTNVTDLLGSVTYPIA